MNINQVVKSNLCLGCGICSFSNENIEMKYSRRKGMNIPVVNQGSDSDNSICPAKGYDIIKNGDALYGESKYSLELGHVFSSYAVYSSSPIILSGASSGGIMTQLAIFLLSKGVVDRVAVTKFVYTEQGPRTKTFLTTSVDEIMASQGSKYCPVDISLFLKELDAFEGSVAYIGTPCQIAGIRELQRVYPKTGNKVKLTIANFCGGFKNYNNIRKIAIRHNINYRDIEYFRFRGGGQPGSMLIRDKGGKIFKAPYPEFTGYTGYSKVLRCHLCVDATGELADISCGDAWLDRYNNDPKPWSIVLCRNTEVDKLLESMVNDKVIISEPISIADVVKSQFTNIYSKKVRQAARFKLYSMLGYRIPHFDGGYSTKRTSLLLELKVFLSHRFKELIECVSLYGLLRVILRKPL